MKLSEHRVEDGSRQFAGTEQVNGSEMSSSIVYGGIDL
jgi:hypothetical protein